MAARGGETKTRAIGALGGLVRGQKEFGTGIARRATKAIVGNKAIEDPTTLNPTKRKAALKAEVRKANVLTTAALQDTSGLGHWSSMVGYCG